MEKGEEESRRRKKLLREEEEECKERREYYLRLEYMDGDCAGNDREIRGLIEEQKELLLDLDQKGREFASKANTYILSYISCSDIII